MKSRKRLITVSVLLMCLILVVAVTLFMTRSPKENAPGPMAAKSQKKEVRGAKSSSRFGTTVNAHNDTVRLDTSRTAVKTEQARQNDFRTVARTAEALPSRAAEGRPVNATGLNLQLKGVVISGDQSSAAIVNRATQEENIYHVNDMIGTARIVQILPGSVILESGGRQEVLSPSTMPTTATEPGGPPPAPRQPRRPVLGDEYPPPDPGKSTLGEKASRLPAAIRGAQPIKSGTEEQ